MESKWGVLFDGALFGVGSAVVIYCILPDGWMMKESASFPINPIIILGGVFVVYCVLFIARKIFWHRRI